MRVISGHWRGRRLPSPPGDRVRPTTDRVKEAMFSIIGPRVVDALVLDLCCGTGGLGIEALSRGARHVQFVDSDRRSLLLAGRNLEICGAQDGSFELVPAEAERHLQDLLEGGQAGSRPWLLLADPPYDGAVAPGLLQRLLAADPAAGPSLAIVEHRDPHLAPEFDAGAWRLRHRRYGQTILTVLERG